MHNKFSVEDFDKVKEFIYRKTGISIDFSICYEKLQNHIENFKDYFFKLRFDDQDGAEFQKLINLITNNETYFYREKEQFEVFIRHILPSLHETIPEKKPIKILCAPCSSGEEAYTILIHIIENSSILKHRDIQITAIDIDSDIIEKAKKSVYTEKSIRNIPEEILNKYFTKDGHNYFLEKELKKYVHFDVVNVFDKKRMLELGKFDVIFSRNMFIYFDEMSRKEVANTFYDLLNKNGFVILGNAEQMSRITSIYSSSKVDDVFVHKK